MSGIAGLLRFDGRPAARYDLDRVANAIRAHGPDRSEVTILGNVGLVHVLMRMTPEDRLRSSTVAQQQRCRHHRGRSAG
jgi:asparagine synthetase B (glutamine-hydrolysing)